MLIGAFGFAVVPQGQILVGSVALLAITILPSATFLFLIGLAGLMLYLWLGYEAKKGF
jgi:hypothetical protein